MWNIRKIVKKGDYLYAVVPEHPKATKNNYVLAHRIIMENEINRMLLNNEEVHHIDGNRYNNSPDNLKIMISGDHQRHHQKLRFPNGKKMITLNCAKCGKEFLRERRLTYQKHKNYFCSRRCNGLFNGFKNKVK